MIREAATTRLLLVCGVAAGPVYIVVGGVHALLRPGFEPTRHALSLLSLGDFGWIQIASFIGVGVLVLLGALGARRRLHPGTGATWGPLLLAVWGVALVGSGIFVADPAPDFPPGLERAAEGMSTNGLLHFVFGAIGFCALAGAALVFSRRYWAEGNRGRSVYAAGSAVGFLAIFAMIASGPASSAVMIAFYGAVGWIWVWHTAMLADLLGAGRSPVDG